MRPLRQKAFRVRNRVLLAGATTSLAKATQSILSSTQKQLQQINQNWIVGRLDDQAVIRNKISIIFDHSRAEIIVGKEKVPRKWHLTGLTRIHQRASFRLYRKLQKIVKINHLFSSLISKSTFYFKLPKMSSSLKYPSNLLFWVATCQIFYK